MIVRELITKLGFNVDEAKIRKYNEDIGAAKQLTQELVGNLQNVARQVTRTGLVLSAALTLPIVGLSAFSVKAAGDMEQLQIGYTTLLGSAEKATKFTQDLLTFAAETPFEFEQLSQYAKFLLAARIEGDKIIPTMSMLGDIASLVGMDKLPQMSRALIDVKNRAKLTGEEVRQFTNAGVAIIPLLADVTGKTTAEISKDISASKISFELLVQALERATGEGGQFYRGMSAQVGTLNQLFSNLGDAVFKFRIRFGELLIQNLPIKQFTVWLINHVELLTLWIERLSPGWRKVVISILAFLSLIGPLLVAIGGISQGLLSLFILLKGIELMFGVKLVAALGKFGAATWIAIAPWIPLILGTIAVLAIFWILIDDIAGWIEGKQSVFGEIFGPFKDFDLIESIKLLGKTFDIFFADIDAWLQKVAPPLAAMLKPFLFAARMSAKLAGGAINLAEGVGSNLGTLTGLAQSGRLNMSGLGAAIPGFNLGSIVPSSGGNTTKSVNVQSTIVTQVPPGTEESQKEALRKTAEAAVNESWERHLRGAAVVFP